MFSTSFVFPLTGHSNVSLRNGTRTYLFMSTGPSCNHWFSNRVLKKAKFYGIFTFLYFGLLVGNTPCVPCPDPPIPSSRDTLLPDLPSRPDFFGGILSSPTHYRLREAWRQKCAPKYREAGIVYRFFIGRVSMDETDHVSNVFGFKCIGGNRFYSRLY